MAGKEGMDPLENAGEEGGGADPLEAEGTEGAQGGGETEGAEGAQGGEGAEGEAGDELLDQAGGHRAAAAPDSQAALAGAIEKLTGALAPKLTPEQQEAAWLELEERTGMPRKALVHQEQVARNAALMANLEVNKEVGRGRVKGITDDDDILSVVEESMKTLPPQIQANPKAWEDAAYMALGKAGKMGKFKQSGKGSEGAGTGQRRVITGTGTVGQSRSGGAAGGKKETPKEYPAFEQHIIDRQFAGKAADYEKYKGKTSVDNDSRYTSGQSGNAADKELERLTAENT